MGVATHIKSPLGIAFAVAASILFLFWRGTPGRLNGRDGLPGFLLMLLVIAAWLGMLYLEGHQDYLRDMLGTQLAGRVLEGGHHAEPWWYYLAAIPIIWAPWVLIILFVNWFAALRGIPAAWKSRRENGGSSWLWIWFFSGAAMLSCVQAKMAVYALPLLAPLAVLTGRSLLRLTPGRSRCFFSLVSTLLALLGLALVLVDVFPLLRPYIGGFLPPVPAMIDPWLNALDGTMYMGGILVLLAVVPVVAVPLYFITRKSVPMYMSVQKSGDKMVRSVQEDITGIRVIKALSKTEYENKKFEGVAGDLASAEFGAQRIMSLTNPLTSLILNLGLVGVIVTGAFLSSEPGDITGFLTYFTIVLNAMLGISNIFVILSRGMASASRIESVLDLDETELVEELPAGDENCAVEFRDVSFSYNGKEDNLSAVSFRLGRGQSLGIIGATGSGKTTIINLLMRFYDVSGGAVYVDGRDVRSVPADDLRVKFGVVFQSDFLMAASVRENIDYDRGLSDDEIWRAAECAQAKEFIDGLEGGLDYDLAQKAGNLSGGQKQRLLIARALAANPEIIVLDDSSSALDYATDAKLRAALAREYASSAKVIVAQRVSSVKNCDLILVMDDGKISGKGTHEELIESCAEYRAIAETQMGVAE